MMELVCAVYQDSSGATYDVKKQGFVMLPHLLYVISVFVLSAHPKTILRNLKSNSGGLPLCPVVILPVTLPHQRGINHCVFLVIQKIFIIFSIKVVSV